MRKPRSKSVKKSTAGYDADDLPLAGADRRGELDPMCYEGDALCGEHGPCGGLQALLLGSSLDLGGVVALHATDTGFPDIVGFLSTANPTDGTLLLFSYCPCCGADLQSFDIVANAKRTANTQDTQC